MEVPTDEINPRAVLWAKSAGLDLGSLLDKGRGGDIPRLSNGQPWTVEFMCWVQSRWREYHIERGHRRNSHWECINCKYDGKHGRFDAWLEGK